MTAFFERIGTCPPVHDEARGADVLAGLAKAFAEREDLAPAAKLLSEEPKIAALLKASFSGAPYLAAIARRDPDLVADCILRDPDEHLEAAQGLLAREVEAAKSQKETMAALRRFKRRMALLVGLADLGGVWSTEETLRALSLAAEAAVKEAVGALFRQAREAGQIVGPGRKVRRA